MILAMQLGAPVQAAATLEQLNEIATILSANDVEGLQRFIDDNPNLLEGDTSIAVLLRRFVLELEDLPTFLAVYPNLSDSLVELVPQLEEGSDSGEEPIY